MQMYIYILCIQLLQEWEFVHRAFMMQTHPNNISFILPDSCTLPAWNMVPPVGENSSISNVMVATALWDEVGTAVSDFMGFCSLVSLFIHVIFLLLDVSKEQLAWLQSWEYLKAFQGEVAVNNVCLIFQDLAAAHSEHKFGQTCFRPNLKALKDCLCLLNQVLKHHDQSSHTFCLKDVNTPRTPCNSVKDPWWPHFESTLWTTYSNKSRLQSPG